MQKADICGKILTKAELDLLVMEKETKESRTYIENLKAEYKAKGFKFVDIFDPKENLIWRMRTGK